MSYSTTLGMTEQDERQGQRHQPYEEQENEANSKTIRRMKVNVRSKEGKRNTHTFETTFQNWKENGEDVHY